MYQSSKIHCIFLVLTLFPISTFALSEKQISEEVLLNLFSSELKNECNTGLVKMTSIPDSTELSNTMDCLIRAQNIIRYDNKEYYIVAAGCVGKGEVLIVNLKDTTVIAKSDIINFPTHYIGLVDIVDVNCDSLPEIVIYQSSGSRASYLIFLTVKNSELLPILNEENQYQFYSSDGSVEYKDIDNDCTYEIIINSRQYSNDSLQNPLKSVLKWDGNKYKKYQYTNDHN